MNEKILPFGDDYMDSYLEIPQERIDDPYVADKKLGGHLRPFDPQDQEGKKEWFSSNFEQLTNAYGEERVRAFFENQGFEVPEDKT